VHVRFRNGVGLPLRVTHYALKEVRYARRGTIRLDSIQTQVLKHAGSLIIGQDKDADTRRAWSNLTDGRGSRQSVVPQQGADALIDLGRADVRVARDAKGDHVLAAWPHAEFAQIFRQVALAAVFLDLHVGQAKVSGKGLEEVIFISAFPDQHYGLGKWRRVLGRWRQRTSWLISAA
jgi:hypothetical protein